MPVRITDVAKECGVSTATVSLAMNDSPLVGAETKKRVKAAAREMGYRPNPYAQALVGKKSGIIGLVIPDIRNVYYASMLHYIDRYVTEAGYALSTMMSGNSQATERKVVSAMSASRVEGLLIAPINALADAPAYLETLPYPAVSISSHYPDCRLPYVEFALGDAIYTLTKQMIAAGRARLAFVSGPDGVASLFDRENAFIRACEDEKQVSHTLIRCSEISYEAACGLIMNESADRLKGIDGFVCVNDTIACGIVNSLFRRGFRVPGDISVCGCDDVIFAHTSPVQIATVRQNLDILSRIASSMLLKTINSGETPQNRVLECVFIPGDSI